MARQRCGGRRQKRGQRRKEGHLHLAWSLQRIVSRVGLPNVELTGSRSNPERSENTYDLVVTLYKHAIVVVSLMTAPTKPRKTRVMSLAVRQRRFNALQQQQSSPYSYNNNSNVARYNDVDIDEGDDDDDESDDDSPLVSDEAIASKTPWCDLHSFSIGTLLLLATILLAVVAISVLAGTGVLPGTGKSPAVTGAAPNPYGNTVVAFTTENVLNVTLCVTNNSALALTNTVLNFTVAFNGTVFNLTQFINAFANSTGIPLANISVCGDFTNDTFTNGTLSGTDPGIARRRRALLSTLTTNTTGRVFFQLLSPLVITPTVIAAVLTAVRAPNVTIASVTVTSTLPATSSSSR